MQTGQEMCGGISASKLRGCVPVHVLKIVGGKDERGTFLLQKECCLESILTKNINFVKWPMFCQNSLDPMSFN